MKDIFILQGKRYISSKRASTISDYTSDYIGQLCRAKKIDCVRIGHAWFVHEDSLLSHKAKVAQDLEAERIRYNQVVDNSISSSGELAKYQEPGVFLPQLKKQVVVRSDAASEIAPRVSVESELSTSLEGSLGAVKAARVSVAPSFIRSAFVMTGMMACVMILFVSSILYFARSPKIVAVDSNTAGVYDALQSISVFFKNNYLALRSFLDRDRQLAINTPSTSDAHDVIPAYRTQGIGVVSSTGSDAADAALKQKIQESFSDEVVVKPDASGTGGIVTPVFRRAAGDDFLYVLVPVNNPDPP